jgi:IMP dehydrogenase
MVPQLTSKVDNLRPAYGFDDISLAPGTDTADPSDVDLSQNFCGIPLAVPIIASAMDAVVSPTTAGLLHKLGSLACINLEGLWFRYDDPTPHFAAISAAAKVMSKNSSPSSTPSRSKRR